MTSEREPSSRVLMISFLTTTGKVSLYPVHYVLLKETISNIISGKFLLME